LFLGPYVRLSYPFVSASCSWSRVPLVLLCALALSSSCPLLEALVLAWGSLFPCSCSPVSVCFLFPGWLALLPVFADPLGPGSLSSMRLLRHVLSRRRPTLAPSVLVVPMPVSPVHGPVCDSSPCSAPALSPGA